MADPSLLFASAAELGRLLRARKISSVQLTKLTLEALETEGRALNAVAEVTRDLALRQARLADRELHAGAARGPLHGIPYGAKDLLATKGIPTRWGSPAHESQVFDYDATVIARLREAGAVLAGKLSMIGLAGGGGYDPAIASATGPCRNPYDRARWAGGSSSGSGAAVGAGLLSIALGTETEGSITCPAAFCNVTGLRPTYGRVPRHGAMALAWTMDKIGVMARTAEDCGRVLAAIAGPDPRDTSCAPDGFRFRPRALDGRKLRLGLIPTDYQKNKAAVARKRFAAAVNVFRTLGHATTRVTLPDYPYGTIAWTIIKVEGAAAFESFLRSRARAKLADPTQQAGLLSGLAVSGVEYLRVMRLRAVAAAEAVHVFARCDALIAPTFLHGAPRFGADGESRMGGNGGWSNLFGWPSISLPMGPDENGLPLGLELIGPPYQEATLLALAMAFQRETDWHRWRPSCHPKSAAGGRGITGTSTR
jgi:aspartyl-tRNA(Asn)/glutamyl-tRNA(Gln) amidotransferase subunit A